MPSASLIFVSANRSSVRIRYNGDEGAIPSNEPEQSSGWSTITSTDTRQVQQKTVTQVVYNIAGCTTTWHWSFSGGNGGSSSEKTGTTTIGGMNAGSKDSVTGKFSAIRSAKKVTKKYTRSRTRSKTITKDEQGNVHTTYGDWSDWDESGPTTSTSSASSKNLGSASDTLVFYTQPAEFSWGSGVAADKIIQMSGGLSANKWNTLVTRVEQRKNWENQSDGADYSDAEVSSGELVTAIKYNILAKALNINQVIAHTDKVIGTLITADVFIALQTAVNA